VSTDLTSLRLGDIAVDVVLKDIKNVHLSVYPPNGRVRISAPKRMSVDTIRVYAVSKLDWIKKQQTILRQQERESRREYLDRESHYLWGRRHLLQVVEDDVAPSVQIRPGRMLLHVRPGASEAAKKAIVAAWYRHTLKAAAQTLIDIWEPRVSVRVQGLFVQQMRTKWGSCNPIARSIRLNTELAKKPRECLEYVVVHELVHLLERRHNDRFKKHMDRFMPQWRQYRDELNRAPLAHVDWRY
jgi:predicted metal-dependent hydrolase